MVNSQVSSERSRKDEKYDFVSYIEEMKNRLDIIQVATLHGITVNNHGQAECFAGHDKKTPSLKLYEDTQTYHCFGCGAHGDVISLVQHADGCSFTQAVSTLARETGIPVYQSNNGLDPEGFARVSDCLGIASQVYHGWLQPADSYLASRGISYDTATKFMIGSTRGKEDLRVALQSKGVAADTMLYSGLVKTDGTDFFQEHIVVPIFRHGRVIDFYGRSLNGDNGHRHWRLPNDRFVVGRGLFNWNPRAEEIILVEGIFDALALIQNGFPNAVATFGTQGLKDRYLKLIANSRIKRIFVCYDGDDSGRCATLRDGVVLEDAGKEVRIVELPDDKDPNDFVLAQPGQDFQGLIDSALSPFDYELQQIIAVELREDQLKRVRDDLLPRVKRADPIMQPDLIKRIHDKLDVPVRALNEQLKLMKQENEVNRNEYEQLVEVGALTTVSPALDLVNGTMVIMAPKRVIDSENHAPHWQNTIVTSHKERFVLTNEELLKREWYAPALERTDIRVAEKRYSAETIDGFLQGSLSGDLEKTFTNIRHAIRLYIDFSDERTYDFLACWIIGTYFFPIFSHYPYVHFTGPKGSGKSQCLHVLRSLCHNAKIAGSMTLAVQFRIIGALQPTLLFDEMENLGQTQHTELHRMLKYGFEKNGPEVWRMESSGNRMEMNCWSVFCPRAFASIEGMEDVIASRSVQVIMERSFNEDIKNRTVNAYDPLWQDLRDRLFLITLEEGINVKSVYDSLDKSPQLHFSGRDWDIFKGILAVAKAVGDDVLKSLLEFAADTHEAKITRDHDNSPDMIILQYLTDTVTESGWWELGALNDGLTAMATSQGLDLQGRMTRDRLGKRIAALRVSEETKRATQSGRKVTLYRIDPEVIAKKLENHLRG
jgi:DNA primase